MTAMVQLNDGTSLPQLGLGLYKVDAEQVEPVLRAGFEIGYRHVDGAQFYGNEQAIGAALRHLDVPDDLVLSSKFWGDPVMSADAIRADFETTMTDLGLDQLGIYMIHWPRPSQDRFVEVWQVLAELQAAGRVRTIGVANFNIEELTRLIEQTGVTPAINQVECHPWLQQRELRAFHEQHQIVTEAWSPLGRGRLLTDPVVLQLADQVGATPAQVVLAWHLAHGISVVPKSTRPERLAENFAAQQVGLDADQLAALDDLERGTHTGTDPKDRR